jgi:DNA-binding transcriptional MerR regulator
MDINMKIGELAKQTGLTTSTIRFYEQKGLLPKAKRTGSGYRVYDKTAQEKLQLIKFSQSLGFSLAELPNLMNENDGLNKDLIMARLNQKSLEIEALLQQLHNKKTQINTLVSRLDQRWQAGECMDQKELAEILEKTEGY